MTEAPTEQLQRDRPAPAATPSPSRGAGSEPPPRLADGTELIGEYVDSGFKDPPYLVRRSDGQVIQMPRLLFLVAEAADGRRSYDEIAETVTQAFRRRLDGGMVRQLVDEQLRPLGVVAQADGSTPQLQKADPLLALKLRVGVIPSRLVNAIAVVFHPLFWPPVVLAVLGTFVALDVWLFMVHGIAQSLRQTLYDPVFILVLLGLVVLSATFHECGHATACRYGGARPGVMGVGIYIVWPAFYTDVTDAYRLNKAGRLRTDLGGVYFNSIFSLGTFGAYFVTGWEPLLLVIPLQIIEMLHQFLPFLRLDGYYIVSDLTGVPDMFARIKPTLASLIPWKKPGPEVTKLKRWVRVATTIYVLTVVPLLLFFLVMTVINVPRIFATAYDSFFVQLHKLNDGGTLHIIVTAIQIGVLGLPVAGIAVTFWKLAARSLKGGWHVTAGRPLARGAFVTAAAALASGVGWVWLPNGDYEPIQRGERGTALGGFRQLSSVRTGRPGFTRLRQHDLGGAPVHESRPTTTSTTPTDETTTTTGTSEPQGTTTVGTETTTIGTGSGTTVPVETQTVTVTSTATATVATSPSTTTAPTTTTP